MKTLFEILMEEDERRTRMLDKDRMFITPHAGGISSGYNSVYSDGYGSGKNAHSTIAQTVLKGEGRAPNYFPTSNAFSQAALQNKARSGESNSSYMVALFQLGPSYLRNAGVLGQQGIGQDYKTPNLFSPGYFLDTNNAASYNGLYGPKNKGATQGLYSGGSAIPRISGIVDSISGVYIGRSGCKSCGAGSSGSKTK